MSSACRDRLGGVAILAGVLLALPACQREERPYGQNPAPAESQEKVALSTIAAGPDRPTTSVSGRGADYAGNAYRMSEGKRLFKAFNCNGCHANGGGDSGPPLMDNTWIYGGRIENIVATIREGRPNGMPSFRARIPDDQIWELAADVRSMSGQAPSDAAPSRDDILHPHDPENRQPAFPPVQGGQASPPSQQP